MRNSPPRGGVGAISSSTSAFLPLGGPGRRHNATMIDGAMK